MTAQKAKASGALNAAEMKDQVNARVFEMTLQNRNVVYNVVIILWLLVDFCADFPLQTYKYNKIK